MLLYCTTICFSPTFNTVFCLQLAKELIGDYSTRRLAGPSGGVICPLALQHFSMKAAKEPLEPERKRRCVRCSERNKKCTHSGFVVSVTCFYATQEKLKQTAFCSGIRTDANYTLLISLHSQYSDIIYLGSTVSMNDLYLQRISCPYTIISSSMLTVHVTYVQLTMSKQNLHIHV